MNTFSAFIKNLVISNLWSILLIIVASAFYIDFLDNEASFVLFICWLINCFISFIIHAFLFVPGIILYKKWHLKKSNEHAYSTIYPILLIPLALYVFLMSLLLSEISPEPNSFGLLAFVGIVLMFMHSISLYTFIHQIFKNHNHEEAHQ